MYKTILIYIKNKRKPFEVVFARAEQLKAFYDALTNSDDQIILLGQLSLAKSEFRYCIEK